MGRKKWERGRKARRETEGGEVGERKGIKNRKEYSTAEVEKHGKRESGGREVKLKRSM